MKNNVQVVRNELVDVLRLLCQVSDLINLVLNCLMYLLPEYKVFEIVLNRIRCILS